MQGGFRTASLGDRPGAIKSYRKALTMRESIAKALPQDREVRRELLRNHGKLSEIMSGEGDMKAATDHARMAVRLAQELVVMPDPTPEDRRNVATALLSLGWQVSRNQQIGDGVLFMRRAIAGFDALRAESPQDPIILRNLALAYGRLGDTLLDNTPNYDQAYTAHSRGLEIAEKLRATDPHNTRYDKVLAYAYIGVGGALSELNQPRAALGHQLKAVDLLRNSMVADVKNDVARYDAAYALGEASTSSLSLGEYQAAQTSLTESLNILSRAGGIAATNMTDAKRLLGLNYYRLGVLHAMRSTEPSLSPAERSAQCADSRKWLQLGEPLVATASSEDSLQWNSMARYTLRAFEKKARLCTPEA